MEKKHIIILSIVIFLVLVINLYIYFLKYQEFKLEKNPKICSGTWILNNEILTLNSDGTYNYSNNNYKENGTFTITKYTLELNHNNTVSVLDKDEKCTSIKNKDNIKFKKNK